MHIERETELCAALCFIPSLRSEYFHVLRQFLLFSLQNVQSQSRAASAITWTGFYAVTGYSATCLYTAYTVLSARRLT